MKNYTLILEDKQGNELTRVEITAKNSTDARKQKLKLQANSKLNDLHYIRIIAN